MYVVEVLPILTLMIYIGGFAYYLPYYYVFGINIISYYSLTEVFINASLPLFLAAATICLFIILNFIVKYIGVESKKTIKRIPQWISKNRTIDFYYYQDEDERIYYYLVDKNNKKTDKKHSEEDYVSYENLKLLDKIYYFITKLKLKRKLKREKVKDRSDEITNPYVLILNYSSLLIIILVLIVTGAVWHQRMFSSTTKLSISSVVFMGCVVFIAVSYELYMSHIKKIKRTIIRRYTIILSSATTFLVIYIGLILWGIYCAENDMDHGISEKIVLITRNEEYSTVDNENLFFIGDCSTSFFLFNKEEKNTVIISKSNIEKVIIFDSKSKFEKTRTQYFDIERIKGEKEY